MTQQEAKILLLLGKAKTITDIIIEKKMIKDAQIMDLVAGLNDEIYNIADGFK